MGAFWSKPKSKDEMLMEAVDKIGKNDSEFKQWVEQMLKRTGTLKIFSTGKIGSGKSTLLNGLFGSKFVVGHSLDPQTARVEKHEHTIRNLKVTVWDSPGLQDKMSDREEDYLKRTKEEIENEGGIDLLFYCIRMDETRSDLDKHGSAICIITNAFGRDIWDNALIVLTFAEMYEHQLKLKKYSGKDLVAYFDEKIKEWKDIVVKELTKLGVDKDVADKLPVHPAGFDTELHLPGREYWASLLWAHTFAAIKDGSKSAFISLNINRLTTEDKEPENTSRKPLEDQPIYMSPTFKEVVLGALKEKKGTLGAAGASPAAAGAAIGTGAGYALKATLVGSAAGAATGAAIGTGLIAYVLYCEYNKQKEEKQKKNE